MLADSGRPLVRFAPDARSIGRFVSTPQRMVDENRGGFGPLADEVEVVPVRIRDGTLDEHGHVISMPQGPQSMHQAELEALAAARATGEWFLALLQHPTWGLLLQAVLVAVMVFACVRRGKPILAGARASRMGGSGGGGGGGGGDLALAVKRGTC